jgi:hypothetical protein
MVFHYLAFCDISSFICRMALGFDAFMACTRVDAFEAYFCVFINTLSFENASDISQVAKRCHHIQQSFYEDLE